MAAANRRRANGPPKNTAGVKMLPKDALAASMDNLWSVEVDIEALTAGDGPSSTRVCVVDFNADLDTVFAPAELF